MRRLNQDQLFPLAVVASVFVICLTWIAVKALDAGRGDACLRRERVEQLKR